MTVMYMMVTHVSKQSILGALHCEAVASLYLCVIHPESL
jgi:hypothetical protein